MKILFDDFVMDEEWNYSNPIHYWACVCKECKKKYNIPEKYLCDIGEGTCSIYGCENEADYYIDFPDVPKENEKLNKFTALEFTVNE